jgi:hypothetical protein
MSRIAAFAIAWTVMLAAPGALSASGDPPPASACDHTRELEAAKRALERGDREGALAHLLQADAILAACQGKTPNAGQPEESVRGHARAPGAEPMALAMSHRLRAGNEPGGSERKTAL